MKVLFLIMLISYLIGGIQGMIKKQRMNGSIAQMALIKWGALAVDGRGKVGGQVLSKNRAGNYIRNKTTPVNPQTIAQVGARNRLTTQSQAWRGLTQAQRDAWDASVEDFKKTNIFGDQVRPTGFNLYINLNATLDLADTAAIADPPAPEAIVGLLTLALSVVNGVAAVTITYTGTPVPANTAYLMYMTPGVSAGRSFVKSEYRFIGFIDAAGASPEDALAAYQAVFGSVPPVGMKVFVKLIPMSKTSGQRGVALSAFFTIVA